MLGEMVLVEGREERVARRGRVQFQPSQRPKRATRPTHSTAAAPHRPFTRGPGATDATRRRIRREIGEARLDVGLANLIRMLLYTHAPTLDQCRHCLSTSHLISFSSPSSAPQKHPMHWARASPPLHRAPSSPSSPCAPHAPRAIVVA